MRLWTRPLSKHPAKLLQTIRRRVEFGRSHAGFARERTTELGRDPCCSLVVPNVVSEYHPTTLVRRPSCR